MIVQLCRCVYPILALQTIGQSVSTLLVPSSHLLGKAAEHAEPTARYTAGGGIVFALKTPMATFASGADNDDHMPTLPR
jgi:hypothetical protein